MKVSFCRKLSGSLTLFQSRVRYFSNLPLRLCVGYSELSYTPDESKSSTTFSFDSMKTLITPLKPMLKSNPSEIEKNSARRLIGNISKQIILTSDSLKYGKLDAKDVLMILHGIYHTSQAQSAGVSKIDLAPIYSYLENCFWTTECDSWTPAEIGEVVKICSKISSVPIVSVLSALVWPSIKMIPQFRPNEVVLVARSFHNLGVHHPLLQEKIIKEIQGMVGKLSTDDLNRILITLLDTKQCASNTDEIKNLLNALIEKCSAAINSLSAPVVSRCLTVLSFCSKNYPGIYGEYKPKFDELLKKLHARSLETISCAPVPDVVDICSHFATLIAKEDFEKIFKLSSERVIALVQNIKPKHLAQMFYSCSSTGILDENLLNMLAEQTCKQMNNFDESELAYVVESLASFDLYDAELFTMVATKLAQKTREREILDPNSISKILMSFVKLKEKNDALLFACAQQFSISLYNLDKSLIENAIAAFKHFDFNHRDILAQLEARLDGMK